MAKETLNLLGCTTKMKDDIEGLNYPRRDAKFQERLRTFRDTQVIFKITLFIFKKNLSEKTIKNVVATRSGR